MRGHLTNADLAALLHDGTAAEVDENSFTIPDDGVDIARVARAVQMLRQPMTNS